MLEERLQVRRHKQCAAERVGARFGVDSGDGAHAGHLGERGLALTARLRDPGDQHACGRDLADGRGEPFVETMSPREEEQPGLGAELADAEGERADEAVGDRVAPGPPARPASRTPG